MFEMLREWKCESQVCEKVSKYHFDQNPDTRKEIVENIVFDDEFWKHIDYHLAYPKWFQKTNRFLPTEQLDNVRKSIFYPFVAGELEKLFRYGVAFGDFAFDSGRTIKRETKEGKQIIRRYSFDLVLDFCVGWSQNGKPYLHRIKLVLDRARFESDPPESFRFIRAVTAYPFDESDQFYNADHNPHFQIELPKFTNTGGCDWDDSGYGSD